MRRKGRDPKRREFIMYKSLWQRFRQLSLLKKIGVVFVALIIVLIILSGLGILLAPDNNRIKTPAGVPINSMHCLTLNEKTKVWISVWLPDELRPELKAVCAPAS